MSAAAAVKKLVRVVPKAVERVFADQCSQLAAGIAYHVLFSIAPLAIVLASVFGLVLQDVKTVSPHLFRRAKPRPFTILPWLRFRTARLGR